jgi:cell wall-associated NlpC family hydrolase
VDGTGPSESVRDDAVVTTDGRPSGRDIVRVARWHIGTRYVSSPPGSCRAYRSEDCSCTTSLVFRKFGKKLPENPVRQWKWGRPIAKSNLRPGDLVFFKEAGRSRAITHVGIFSGRGNFVHASTYFGKVVESKMRYMRGYYGAKRIRWR